jgi:hypothetical protein
MINNLIINNAWATIKDLALNTIGKENKNNSEPSSEWKRKILLSEHSPIRNLTIKWMWSNLPYFVSVHFVRHKFGIEHYVKTQRDDRNTSVNQTHLSRENSPQNTPVNHTCVANAQAIINISRKRLCNCASKETREAWQAFLDSFKDKENELYNVCVKECIYRGFCPEYKSCGFHKTSDYKNMLSEYRKGINE